MKANLNSLAVDLKHTAGRNIKKVFIISFVEQTKVKYLHFYQESFCLENMEEIRAFKRHTALESLHLDYNKICAENVLTISKEIKQGNFHHCKY